MSINTTASGATLSSSTTTVVGGGGGPPPSYIFHDLNNIGLGYAIAIALGLLILFSAVVLSSYLCFRFTRHHHRHNRNPNRSNTSDNGIIVPRIVFVAEDDDDDEENGNRNAVVGLDQAVINSYPKFPFSKDHRLGGGCGGGGGNDSVCPICLCEYKEPEMMRMLPDCHHCFHLTCVDAWLKLNASCPVCRSSPLPTPLSTPLSEVVPLSQYSDGRRR